ncbi:hypothetical protein [Alteribacillus iranensis]|uniref:Uncharacterized protein n=1 Tax=Alteribacillus iranensis TaxID=930128 RepID=A0A1I1ZYF0_9BACI|nr:hypothetical protein [Alteribacillus iranensis]SFE36527.1 hypothetical protein SAMN05192532_101521 [Alteribacillus iranensis]
MAGDKERKRDKKAKEIERETIREIDHTTEHPDQEDISLQQDAFSPKENHNINDNYING